MAVILPVRPPLKENIYQKTGSQNFLEFNHHSVQNYLNYPPSFKNIKKHYSEVLSDINKNEQLVSGKTHIDCKNISDFVDKNISPFEIKKINNTTFKADTFSYFKNYTVERSPSSFFEIQNSEEKFVLNESWNNQFLLFVFILLIFHKFFIKILLLSFINISKSVSNDENKDDENQ